MMQWPGQRVGGAQPQEDMQWPGQAVVQPPMQRQTQQRPAQRAQQPRQQTYDPFYVPDEPQDPNDLNPIMPESGVITNRALVNDGIPKVGEQYMDPKTGEMRYVGAVLNPGDEGYATPEGVTDTFDPKTGAAYRQTPGYILAAQQEREKRANIPGYGQENISTMTTGFANDEFDWLAGYGSQAVANLGRTLTGQDSPVSARERADAMYDLANKEKDQFTQERPVSAALASLGGGFAFAPARAAGALAGANGFAQQGIRQGFGQAAGIGGSVGFADTDGGLKDRLAGGAGMAAASLATVAGLGAAGRMIPGGGGASRIENRAGSLIERELKAGRVSPQDFMAQMNGAPAGALPLNIGDGALAGAAEVMAQSPGPGGRVVRSAVGAQRDGASNRVQSRIGEALGGEGNYFATLDANLAQRKAAADAAMQGIEGQRFRLTDDAVQALRGDVAQNEIRQSAQLGLISADPAVRANAARLNQLADVLRDNPAAAELDIRTAQDVSKVFLDASREAWGSGNGRVGRAYGDLGNTLRNNAREAVPEYRAFLDQYGDDSARIDALELGRGVFRNADDLNRDGVSAENLRKSFDQMTPDAQEMFRKGVGEAMIARARTSRGGVGAMRDLLKTEEFGDRARIAFPDEASFSRFLSAAEGEVGMADVANNITGNSRTAYRQAAQQRLGASPVEDATNSLSNVSLLGLPLELGRRGVRAAGSLFGNSRSPLKNDDLGEAFGRALTEPEVLRSLLMRQPRRGLFGGRAVPGGGAALPLAGYSYASNPQGR